VCGSWTGTGCSEGWDQVIEIVYNKAYMKTYYEANRGRIAERMKAYYEANRDKFKAYYEANRGRIAERMKAYYEANRDKFKAYREANRGRIAERMKAYYEANRDKFKAYREAKQPVCQGCGRHVPSVRKASVDGKAVWICSRCLVG
jgi:hypothetical protein